MTSIATRLLPTGLFALGVLAVIGIIFATQWYFVSRPQRATRDRGLLREPGRALRRRLDAVDHRLVGAAVGLPVTLVLWFLSYGRALHDTGGYGVFALAAAGVIALGWFAQEILHLWPERIRLVRAIDAQMITAQSLNLLMRSDYWVFHDVHIGEHRINHVVMGPRGVFCVDTRWRRPRRQLTWKGLAPAPRADAAFDGRLLRFPGWEEADAYEDVVAQARWLGAWLTKKAGEDVPAHAAIALPGWRVVSTDWKRVIVFNPATPNMLVQGGQDSRLDASVARDLVKQLQRHCREHADTRVRRHRRRRGNVHAT